MNFRIYERFVRTGFLDCNNNASRNDPDLNYERAIKFQVGD